MDHVVYRVLPSWIAVGVEETERIVAAAVYSDGDLARLVVSTRCSLRTADGRLVVGVADTELVVIGRVWRQVVCFYFDGVVNVRCRVCGAFIHNAVVSQVLLGANFVVDTDWCG